MLACFLLVLLVVLEKSLMEQVNDEILQTFLILLCCQFNESLKTSHNPCNETNKDSLKAEGKVSCNPFSTAMNYTRKALIMRLFPLAKSFHNPTKEPNVLLQQKADKLVQATELRGSHHRRHDILISYTTNHHLRESSNNKWILKIL